MVATTNKNSNASLVYSFLYKLVEVSQIHTGVKLFSQFNICNHIKMSVLCFLQVFTEYFKELEEESIQDNFVVVYELLDELMDFGFPQTTDSKILQE